MPSLYANPAVRQGSLALVTGANGFIGMISMQPARRPITNFMAASHIADKFIAAGLKVRGTVRSQEKGAKVAQFFNRRYGPGHFEYAVVPDMGVEGAYDEAVKGASIFCHTAATMSFDRDPAKVIPTTVGGALMALKAAAKESSIQRFVYTSSSMAVRQPRANEVFEINENTWNEEAMEQAWTRPQNAESQ